MSAKLPGRIVRFRLSPDDQLSLIDVVGLKMGQNPERFSFDQVARLAVIGLLRQLRLKGIIPTRDGFEYNKMMAPFLHRSPPVVELTNAEASRLNTVMFNDEVTLPSTVDELDELLRRQKEIKMVCRENPYGHPDENDVKEYANTIKSIYAVQGVETSLTDDELLELAKKELPERKVR